MERCRLCLSITGEATDSIAQTELQKKLEWLFHLTFVDNDSLPQQVCHTCMLKVQDFYSYAQQVHRCQNFLAAELELGDELKEEEPDPMEGLEVVVIKLETSKGQTSDDGLQSDEEQLEEYVEIQCEDDPKAIDEHEENEVEERIEEDENDDGYEDSREEEEREKEDEEEEEEEDEEEEEEEDDDEEVGAKKKPTTKVGNQSARLADDNRKILEFFKLTCEICSETSGSFHKLQLHYRKMHATRGFLRCCDRKFYRKFKVLDHIANHVTPDAYRCEICQTSYRTRYTLSQHNSRRHAEPKNRPHKCTKCHQSYEKEYQLKAHSARHIQSPCPTCGRILSSNQALRVHIAHMHGEDEKLICDSCGQQFRTKPAMDRHVRKHLGLEVVEKQQCAQCGVWVNGKRGLRNHTRNVHPGKDEIFECDICHQRCKNATTLYQHRKGVHAEDRFECEFCGKRFKRKIYLKEHRASHTGQSLYFCDICGLTTNSNANMYSHKKSKHPVEWREAQERKTLEAAAAGAKSIAAQKKAK